MPKYLHELPESEDLFQIIGDERGIAVPIIEKDYWVMHCLWGLQRNGFGFEMKGGTSLSKGWKCIDRFSEDIDIRFDPPKSLNIKGDKPAHILARLVFYDAIAAKIAIPGIQAERKRSYDDDKGQNGGIILKYDTRFTSLAGLHSEVLLEVGFAKTAPNEPCDFGSWALEGAVSRKLPVADTRARAVKCFKPEYTFVDKLQTICRRFRQHRERGMVGRDRPREFLRHYYDLFKLIGLERVQKFIGTQEYEDYKAEKIRGGDREKFKSMEPFMLSDSAEFKLFEKEFLAMNTLLIGPGPKFGEMMDGIRASASRF